MVRGAGYVQPGEEKTLGRHNCFQVSDGLSCRIDMDQNNLEETRTKTMGLNYKEVDFALTAGNNILDELFKSGKIYNDRQWIFQFRMAIYMEYCSNEILHWT